MKRKIIFKKLVDGYKTQVKWGEKGKPTVKSISTFPKGPLEIKGEVSIKEHEKKELKEFEGLDIPEFDTKRVSEFGIQHKEEDEIFSSVYPLIPVVPEKNELIMAYAKIQWNPNKSRHEYIVVQSHIPPKMKRLIIKASGISNNDHPLNPDLPSFAGACKQEGYNT